MSDVVLWQFLTIVGLAVIVFGVWLFSLNRKEDLTVVEPIESLITDWQIARFEPNTETFKALFKALTVAHLSGGTLLENILSNVSAKTKLRSKALKLTPTHQEAIAPLGLRLITEGSKTQSLVIGPLGQIEGWFAGESLAKAHHLSLQAAENGFLALAIGAAVKHGRSQPTRHRLTGLVILEPAVSSLALNSTLPTRFLTVLPYQLAHHLYAKLFPQAEHFGLNAEELETLAPKFAEADLAKATVIGSADLAARHRVLQSWQQRFKCRYVSTNPEDSQLPTRPASSLA